MLELLVMSLLIERKKEKRKKEECRKEKTESANQSAYERDRSVFRFV